jgi:hypothetical protein
MLGNAYYTIQNGKLEKIQVAQMEYQVVLWKKN